MIRWSTQDARKRNGCDYIWRGTADSIVDLMNARPSKANEAHNAATYDRVAHDGQSDTSDPSWYGHRDGVEGAVRVARMDEDWPEGDRLMRQAGAELGDLPTVKRRRRRRRKGADGFELDADRLYTGALDKAWTYIDKPVSDQKGSGVVHVVCTWSASGGISASQFVWSAAAAVAVANALDVAGYPVEITLLKAWGGDYALRVPLKAAGEPLDAGRVFRYAAHPGVYRTLGFHAAMTCPGEITGGVGGVVGMGRGHGAWKSESVLRDCWPDDLDGAIVAPHPNDCRTVKAAQAWYRKTLKAYGLGD
jgi:hypothetical protein